MEFLRFAGDKLNLANLLDVIEHFIKHLCL